jgi:putative SOS response-associated peptidase YedK
VCTRYIPPETAATERFWNLGARQPWERVLTFSGGRGPFVRAARHESEARRELVTGRFGLIPWFAESPQLKFSTMNARYEELAQKASYRDPWKRGQRCLVLAESFDEPCWESGKNVWWRLRRADGEPWLLAGLWNAWVDKRTGEVVESFTMLTINADAHPLMRRMHKPDPKRPPDAQDKRSVVPIDRSDADRWLFAPQVEAASLVRLAPPEDFDAQPT